MRKAIVHQRRTRRRMQMGRTILRLALTIVLFSALATGLSNVGMIVAQSAYAERVDDLAAVVRTLASDVVGAQNATLTFVTTGGSSGTGPYRRARAIGDGDTTHLRSLEDLVPGAEGPIEAYLAMVGDYNSIFDEQIDDVTRRRQAQARALIVHTKFEPLTNVSDEVDRTVRNAQAVARGNIVKAASGARFSLVILFIAGMLFSLLEGFTQSRASRLAH